MTRSGGWAAAAASASVPVAARAHLVVAGAQVDAQGPQDLRLVVDDEDAGHRRCLVCVRAGPGAAGGDAGRRRGSETTMVSPPPGVSSGSRVPPMASARPRDSASPRPTPVVLSVSPRRWNGQEDPVPVVGRDAGAAVDDPDLDPVAEPAAGQVRRACSAGE